MEATVLAYCSAATRKRGHAIRAAVRQSQLCQSDVFWGKSEGFCVCIWGEERYQLLGYVTILIPPSEAIPD